MANKKSDLHQLWQAAFDEQAQAFKTTATIVADPIMMGQDVEIDASEDSIAIADPITGSAVEVLGRKMQTGASQVGSWAVSASQIGTWNIGSIVGPVALPTGAATEALQSTQIGRLTSLDTKIVKSDTDNVIVTATVLPAGAATSSAQQSILTELEVIEARLQNGIPVNQQGTWNVNAAQSGPWSVAINNLPATQPVSGTVTVEQGTNPWVTSATQSGVWNVTNITGTISLPTGASTAANQTTGNTSLASIDTKTPALVTAASDADLVTETAPRANARSYGFNGTTWERLRTAVVGSNVAATGLSAAALYGQYQSTLSTVTSGLFNALKTSIRGVLLTETYSSLTNRFATITPFGELTTSQAERLVGTTFPGTTFNALQFTTTTANGATAVVLNNVATLNSGTNAAGNVIVTSVKVARFMAGCLNIYRSGMRVSDTGLVGNIRRWGVFDASNGAFFQLNGTTLQVVTRKNGVDTAVSQASFNGIPYTLDTNFHTYEIFYSAGQCIFVVDRNPLHTLGFTQSSYSGTYDFRLGLQNINTTNTTNCQLEARVISILRYGPNTARPQFTRLSAGGTTVLKNGPGTLHRVVVNTASANGTLLTLYDNVSATGTIIAQIELSINIGTLEYDVEFDVGLTAVVTAVATAIDATILFD